MDPNGAYSRFGAWWRAKAWGGKSFYSAKRDSWGVQYSGRPYRNEMLKQGSEDDYEKIDVEVRSQFSGTRQLFGKEEAQRLYDQYETSQFWQKEVESGRAKAYEHRDQALAGWINMALPLGKLAAPAKSVMLAEGSGITVNQIRAIATEAASAGRSLAPLGLGNTGRTVAASLNEMLTMAEIMSNPAMGRVAMEGLKDSRWLGWSKMEYVKRLGDNSKVVVHYVGKFVNGVLVAVDDFKFKDY